MQKNLKPNQEVIQQPPRKHNVKNRIGVDWDILFELWCESDLTKAQFFRQFGMNSRNGYVMKNSDRFTKENRMTYRKSGINKMNIDPAAVKNDETLWDMVQAWRKNQGSQDYKTADAIRMHVKLFLNSKIVTITDKETGKQTMQTRVTAQELGSLSRTLQTIQQIQRLALGMSTHNIGIDEPDNVTARSVEDDAIEKGAPVFIVQVNKNGKFERARPRRVGG